MTVKTRKKNNILQKIFSIKNQDIHKIITVFGFKVKVKSSKLVIRSLEKEINRLEDYITVQDNYDKVLKRLREKIKTEPLKVVFLSNEPQKWGYDSLYREFEKSEDFNPLVLVYPRKRTLEGNDKTLMSVDEEYKFFKDKNINVDYWYKDGKFTDLKSFNPDIVFYTQIAELPEYDSPAKISEYALTCYCPYGYEMSDYRKNYLPDFHKNLWCYICEHELNIKRYERYKKGNSKNCVALGYPKLDIFMDNREIDLSKYWKDPDKVKIIYSPHHSLNDIYNFSTFLENGKFILELAKKHSDITTWIFKPHPMLKYRLLKGGYMTEKEVDEYYAEWGKIGRYYYSGDYFDIFKSSDLMINDCASFLVEYLPTGKPMIRMRKHGAIQLNELGELFSSQYYNTFNNEELEKVFNELVIQKNDYKREDRVKLIPDLIDFNESSAHKICNYLYNQMKGN